MWPETITAPLRGKTALWKVFWIYGFGASLVYSLLGSVFLPVSPLGLGVYFALGLLLGVVQSVMLWKCAFNSRFPVLGRFLRASIVIGLLMVPLVLYLAAKYPDALLPN